jgi:hypothetical protein
VIKNMDALFTAFENLLNDLIPAGAELATEFATFNEFISYGLTLGLMYVVFLRPLLKLFKIGQGK